MLCVVKSKTTFIHKSLFCIAPHVYNRLLNYIIKGWKYNNCEEASQKLLIACKVLSYMMAYMIGTRILKKRETYNCFNIFLFLLNLPLFFWTLFCNILIFKFSFMYLTILQTHYFFLFNNYDSEWFLILIWMVEL